MKNLVNRIEDNRVIEYVKYCLSLPNGSSRQGDETVIMLYTKQYGILTPSMVYELISKGCITVIYNKKVA